MAANRSDQTGAWDATCGAGLWAAAPILADYLSTHRDILVKDRNVIELGGGLGFVSTAASKMGARRVLCTDQADMLPLMRRNVDENAALRGPGECAVEVEELTWGEPFPAAARDGHWDLVLGSDLVYDEDWFPSLARTLDALFDSNGKWRGAGAAPSCLLALSDRAEFSESKRNHEPDYEVFFKELARPEYGGFTVAKVHSVSAEDAQCASNIDIFSVERASASVAQLIKKRS